MRMGGETVITSDRGSGVVTLCAVFKDPQEIEWGSFWAEDRAAFFVGA